LYLLFISCLLLLVVTASLLALSRTHNGLGADNGSAGLLFGWRYTPTAIAVLYVQLTTILLEDVKRTEPFARLASSRTYKASYTILQAPGAWWNALADGLSKSSGGRSWILVSATAINIIGFLIISPLSSALLSSEDIQVPKDIPFTAMAPQTHAPMALTADRETYFRTISHVLQNVSTSAWISDNYTVFPFWPSDLSAAPLGPIISSTTQSWEAESMVFKAELDCQPMTLNSTASRKITVTDAAGYTASDKFWSIELSATSGCVWGLELDGNFDIVQSGGASWGNLSTITNPLWSTSSAVLNMHTNHSMECGDEALLVSTAWAPSGASGNSLGLDFSSKFSISAHVCSTQYYMANMTVTALLSEEGTDVSFSEADFQLERVPVPATLFDTTGFQDLALDAKWSYYVTLPEGQERPATSGLTVVLGALYDFNITAMIADDNLVNQASSIKQRFLGEVIQSSLTQPGASQQQVITGKVIVVEPRVVVNTAMAAVLVVTFGISAGLVGQVWWASSLRRRPLNLVCDPATTTAIASLLLSEKTAQSLARLDQSSKVEMESYLQDRQYYTVPGCLLEDPASDDLGKMPNSYFVAITKNQRHKDKKPPRGFEFGLDALCAQSENLVDLNFLLTCSFGWYCGTK
jgi:hypothetical protein